MAAREKRSYECERQRVRKVVEEKPAMEAGEVLRVVQMDSMEPASVIRERSE